MHGGLDAGGDMETVTEMRTSDTGDRARPVVLLEGPESADTGELWEALDAAGYRVTWCPGPAGPPPVWCPLLGGERCTLVESADAVVCGLGFEHQVCRQVLAGLERLHPDMPVIVPATAGGAGAGASPGTRVTGPVAVPDVVETVAAALRLRS